uniref:Uncharacterized protein n=1 Tax=Callorhinchus milii TaxID=7868 RepID=A0A4W3IR40_CALMI
TEQAPVPSPCSKNHLLPPTTTTRSTYTVGPFVAQNARRGSTIDGILSPQQRQFYEENGFLLIKNLVSEENLDLFRWALFEE